MWHHIIVLGIKLTQKMIPVKFGRFLIYLNSWAQDTVNHNKFQW